MKIVNPLYDHAFKYLMQNDRIAKKVLSTLLECEVLELNVEQQELVALDEQRGLKLYRLDFSAVIINEKGEKQKVLIELQKSKLPTNTLRFRSYLGKSYAKKEIEVDIATRKETTTAYPIISIYILGYNVVDIPYLAVNIDNRVTDTVTKKEVEVQSDFINLLTHKTRIIQVRRLKKERQSRLEHFLLLFNQTWVTNEKFIIDMEEVPEEFKDIADYLGGPVHDEAFRNQLEGEEEIDAIFREQEAELAQKEEKLNKALEGQEEERRQKEEERKRKEKAQHNFALYLLDQGVEIKEITRLTGLNEEEIKALKG